MLACEPEWRLDVGVLRAKKLLGSLARQVLDDVGKFTAAVIAFAWIPFRILVGKDRTGRLKHSHADKIF